VAVCASQAAAAAAVEGNVVGAVGAAAKASTGQQGSGAAAAGSSGSSSSSSGVQGKVQRVLMGHSLGGACAALEYINNPKVWRAGAGFLCLLDRQAAGKECS
jgi:hypothetical protein